MTQEERPVLTEEQLEYFSELTARAVKKSTRRYVRGAVAGFLVLLVGIGFTIHANSEDSADARNDLAKNSQQAQKALVQSGRAVAVDGCNRDYKTIRALRKLIADSKGSIQQYVEDGTLTPAQAKRAVDQIDKQIKSYPLPDCRSALNVITDNPEAGVKVPVPLHPSDGK